MRIAIINMVPYGSTGKIMLQIARVARERGHEVRTYSTEPYSMKRRPKPFVAPDHFQWGSFRENMFHYYLGSTFGRNGCYSKSGTKQLIQELERFAPDVLHLHNLHSFCIHFPTLFRYIKKNNIRTVWTLHDCWTFTGQCPHFDMFGCDKWKTGCHHCKQPMTYPKSRVDNSKRMYERKKKWFTGVQDMTLVTPSQWLADLTRESFLKEYPVNVIHNGIDLSVFQPTQSSFREKYGCEDKYILLGVAFGWGQRKGLDVFVELSRRLDKHYQIVLVGTDEETDRRLPENIISIHQTQNQEELAQIYSAADLFVNPTREEVFGLVNTEALACGTPVLTFHTGGSPEILDESCGAVVEKNDVDGLEREIIRICGDRPYSCEDCLTRAKQFDMNSRFGECVKLYEEILGQ